MTICDWPAWMAMVLRVVKDRESFMLPSPPPILPSAFFCPPHVSSVSPVVITRLNAGSCWKLRYGGTFFFSSLFFWVHFRLVSYFDFLKVIFLRQTSSSFSSFKGLFLLFYFPFSLVFIVGGFTCKVPQTVPELCWEVFHCEPLQPDWWLEVSNLLKNNRKHELNKNYLYRFDTVKAFGGYQPKVQCKRSHMNNVYVQFDSTLDPFKTRANVYYRLKMTPSKHKISHRYNLPVPNT